MGARPGPLEDRRHLLPAEAHEVVPARCAVKDAEQDPALLRLQARLA